MRRLPLSYSLDSQIYRLAKSLGQSEQEIKEQYTISEIIERNLFEQYDGYIERELTKAK